MKKFMATMLAATVALSSGAVLAGCNKSGGGSVTVDETKTQLNVALYEGGVGRAWLDNSIKRFEEEYADYEFEPGTGKKGAQIMVNYSKSYDGLSLATTLPTNSADEVIFVNAGNYFDLAPYAMDLSSVINYENPADGGKSIKSKLSDEQLNYLTVNNGVRAIPNWELFEGPCYDAGVFESKNLYFSDTIDTADTTWSGTRRFVVNATTKKSPGPDGQYNTYDDGLPSSIHEFYKLMDKMTKNQVDPFTWTGASDHYTNQLLRSIFANYSGADAMNVLTHFDSNGKEVEIVTGFDANGKPVIEKEVLTLEDAYKIRQAAGIYYAIEFAQKLYSNSQNFYKDSNFDSFSHLDAMEAFLNSGLDGTEHIGMIIDGSWWYNEAYNDGQFERLEYDYPSTYTQKKPLMMPMPVKYSGTVMEGEGHAPVLRSTLSGLTLVNNKIKDNHIEVMTKFIQFLYKDSEMLEFTKDTNGCYKGVNYDYSSIMPSLNDFAQSSLKMLDAAMKGDTYVAGYSNESIYVQNLGVFGMGNEFWSSGSESMASAAFHYLNGTTQQNAILYFQGMALHKDTWTNMLP